VLIVHLGLLWVRPPERRRWGKLKIVREPEIKLKLPGSSADLQAGSGTIARAMGEPIGRVMVVEDER
jgi:hypothetical protein